MSDASTTLGSPCEADRPALADRIDTGRAALVSDAIRAFWLAQAAIGRALDALDSHDPTTPQILAALEQTVELDNASSVVKDALRRLAGV